LIPLINSYRHVSASEFFFEDDFGGTDGWNDVGGFTGQSGGVMTGDLNRSGTNHGSYIAMSGSVSDTEWIMRYKFTIDSLASGVCNTVALYLSDADVIGINENKNGIGLGLMSDAPLFQLSLFAPNNTYSTGNRVDVGTPIATTYYVEVKRLSPTVARMVIYSDSSFETIQHDSGNHTISSSIINLDNVTIQGMNDSGSGGTWGITIDDIQIKDGVSTW
jgi:hypothetical protein